MWKPPEYGRHRGADSLLGIACGQDYCNALHRYYGNPSTQAMIQSAMCSTSWCAIRWLKFTQFGSQPRAIVDVKLISLPSPFLTCIPPLPTCGEQVKTSSTQFKLTAACEFYHGEGHSQRVLVCCPALCSHTTAGTPAVEVVHRSLPEHEYCRRRAHQTKLTWSWRPLI